MLNNLLIVEVQSGHYDYGAVVPFLRFKDKAFSLTVNAPETGQ